MTRKDYELVADALVSAFGICLESSDERDRGVVAGAVREVAAVLACRMGAVNSRFNGGYFHARVDQGLEQELSEFLANNEVA